MYHRFNENKYPSTNIKMDIFEEHINIIKNSDFNFHNPNNFDEQFNKPKQKKEILITIDDAFESFYTEAWPYLKENKIPFILFVSTEPVGKRGYMTWEQIKEVEGNEFANIGHHSHTHEYLIDVSNDAFGQHSGVIDLNKNKFELPRFPINEKYGELKRFKSIINYFPLEYKRILPEEKQLFVNTNPPNFKVEFFKEQKNLSNINCYSNEGDVWEKSKTNFANNSLTIEFREPFKPRRGRINCSLNDNGKWRWFGVQFPIKVIEN